MKVKGHDLKQVYFDPVELALVLWYEDIKQPLILPCQNQSEADEYLKQIGWIDNRANLLAQ